MTDLAGWEQYHGGRYRFLIDTIREYYEEGMSIAVFGASLEVPHIKKAFPSSTVDSYGLKIPPFDVSVDDLVELDLNEPIRLQKQYDIGVCAEVVEHLDRDLALVVNNLLYYCNTVIVQTPNARMLCARLRLFKSKSAWEYTKERWNLSGHTREYTLTELTKFYRPTAVHAHNYVGGTSWKRRLYNLVCECLPMEFRDGFTIVYSRT